MARWQNTAPYAGKAQKYLAARYWRVLANGGTLPKGGEDAEGRVAVGQPALRQAIAKAEQALGLGPLPTQPAGKSVSAHAQSLAKIWRSAVLRTRDYA